MSEATAFKDRKNWNVGRAKSGCLNNGHAEKIINCQEERERERESEREREREIAFVGKG